MSPHDITSAEYAAALATGQAAGESEVRAKAIRYVPERDAVEILTSQGAGFLIPRQWIEALKDVALDELAKLTVWPDGSAIELEDRDIQISVSGLLSAVLPAMLPARAIATLCASRGGQSTSAAKKARSRENGLTGGRPRKRARQAP